MPQNTPSIPRRPARKPRPVAGSFACPLIDKLEEQFEELEFYRTDGAHDPRNPEPPHQRAKARFWQDINRQIGVWGGAPPAIAEEIAQLSIDKAPML